MPCLKARRCRAVAPPGSGAPTPSPNWRPANTTVTRPRAMTRPGRCANRTAKLAPRQYNGHAATCIFALAEATICVRRRFRAVEAFQLESRWLGRERFGGCPTAHGRILPGFAGVCTRCLPHVDFPRCGSRFNGPSRALAGAMNGILSSLRSISQDGDFPDQPLVSPGMREDNELPKRYCCRSQQRWFRSLTTRARISRKHWRAQCRSGSSQSRQWAPLRWSLPVCARCRA